MLRGILSKKTWMASQRPASCWTAQFAHLCARVAFGWFDQTAISPVRPVIRRQSPITWTASFGSEPLKGDAAIC
jgi:hypothetical protein